MKSVIISICILLIISSCAESNPKWDTTDDENWPNACKEVLITSSLDNEKQPSMFYTSKGENRPLIVSLHTWSGNYKQKDELVNTAIQKDYNYIHPNFRGPNNSFKACGSSYVVQDIEDAIGYALEKGNVDINNIHIIGASGGGHATLLTYMKTKYPIKTFSAWVPISDLKKWYYESEGRDTKYALDIAQATSKNVGFNKENYSLNEEEAIKRSPFYMQTPVDNRKNSKLYIYAGIHDGYTGSVPITQSLNFYNKVIADFDKDEKNAIIPQEDIIEMVASRNFIKRTEDTIANRQIHYQKTYKDLVKITIFEGTHECLTSVALNQVEAENILTIGDSNGAKEYGWVNQLKAAHFENFIYNTSISGNTIGFNNNGQEKLNTLFNIYRYLNEADKNLGALDKILIMLGTNDCKAVFEKRKKEIPRNMAKLLKGIKTHAVYLKYKPQIFVISPPPCGEDDIMLEKYYGSSERVKWLTTKLEKVTRSKGLTYIDIYTPLAPQWSKLAIDGIHPEEEGQLMMSKIIDEHLK
ncbi:prolyl oligopeptidase family serine peptidase [Aurantibacter crassamenti]|uniref:SGNH/GDSL hydrolase family protein n=1 Tax=Aurantibacter crassamenti TaxID=1837375 RepID=UPI00193A6E7C|nr:GDSL-type esterase/lipase family protein [Aurantibacter crassamenti]MBM1105020.1 prolyl oligopeptidase family serine peptidase [Aurantibacter crassamenti]